MLQKGIIESIEDRYTVRVRIPKYDKLESSATGTKYDDLAFGIICTLPGMSITYAVGDIVLVDFENDELSKPVILGLLYRDHESKSTIELASVDNSINTINEKLSSMSSGMYTHIKYSNDNGVTFTSLFDITQVETDEVSNSSYNKYPIYINPNSKYIHWSVVDPDGVDITESFSVSTIVTGSNNSTGLSIINTFDTPSIELPFLYRGCTEIYLSFNTIIPREMLETYHIVLTTDIDIVGSVYGDYIGLYISNSSDAPEVPSYYSWSSIVDRNNYYVESLKEELLKRIQANEIALRGYSEDEPEYDNEKGLLDAISIETTNMLVGKDRDIVYFGNTNQYISTSETSLHTNTITQQEFEFSRISNTRLVLFYNSED